MVRVTNAVASHRRKKRMLKIAKGFWGDRKNHLRMTNDAVLRALANNYKHRKLKKREFKSLWIVRISAAAKAHGISYSKLIHGLLKAKCGLNRKMLADMAIRDPDGFKAVVGFAKAALA
ncbi:MAG: 50S ribosomal protein L20 [Chlamydiia bacterium]|nr:50S ribosomal protein L20 [Chlamydiia bacterium]